MFIFYKWYIETISDVFFIGYTYMLNALVSVSFLLFLIFYLRGDKGSYFSMHKPKSL